MNFLKPGKEQIFLEAWNAITEFIYQYEGSYGSRLHYAGDNVYISYAQWPDRETWEKSDDNMPPESMVYRLQLLESCREIKTEYELEPLSDKLINTLYDRD